MYQSKNLNKAFDILKNLLQKHPQLPNCDECKSKMI